jgi:hypothetical protein
LPWDVRAVSQKYFFVALQGIRVTTTLRTARFVSAAMQRNGWATADLLASFDWRCAPLRMTTIFT